MDNEPTLNKLRELDAEIGRYECDRDGHQQYPLADALLRKAWLLLAANRREEGVACLERVGREFADTTDDRLVLLVGRAHGNLGYELTEDGRPGDGISALDEAIRNVGDREDLGARRVLARALYDKAVALERLGHHDEAVGIVDDLVARFASDPDATIILSVADGRLVKARIQRTANQSAEARAAYDEFIEEYGDSPEPGLRERTAVALGFKAEVLTNESIESAIAAYDELIRRFGSASEPELRFCVVAGLCRKGRLLETQGRLDDALGVYRQVIASFDQTERREILDHVEWAQSRIDAVGNHGDVLADRDGGADYRDPEGVTSLMANAALEARIADAHGLMTAASVWRENGQTARALECYQQVVDDFASDPEPALRRSAAMALAWQAKIMSSRDAGAALFLFEQIVRCYSQESDAALRLRVAAARCRRGALLEKARRRSEALKEYDRVVRDFGPGDGREIEEHVVWAQRRRRVLSPTGSRLRDWGARQLRK